MKSAIEEIYRGNIGSNEQMKESQEYWEINKEYCALYDKMLESLDDGQKEILNKIYEASGGLESEAACARFKEGFKLGMLVAAEVFGE